MKATQLELAETLGALDYGRGIIAVAQSKKFMDMLQGRKIGETPKFEASTIELMDAWKKGWNKAKSVTMKERFEF